MEIENHLYEDQYKHLIYSLRRLGFNNITIRSNYVNEIYSYVKNKYKNRWMNGFNRLYGEEDFYKITYRIITNEMHFKKHSLIPIGESSTDINGLAIKRIDDYLKLFQPTDYITATDISSFVFCPVSYCIRKCFDEFEERKDTIVGTEMHERNRLVDYIPGTRAKYKLTPNVTEPAFYTSKNRDFFDDVRSSTVYYVGHDENSKRYFKSSKGSFVGQPDYIFTNANGEKFIIEEKFRLDKKESTYVASHHKAQLSSYLIGLDGIKASYGYLVYWYYAYEENIRRIKKCIVFKIASADVDRVLLKSIYQNVKFLNRGKTLQFDSSSLDTVKCANCIVRSFCGHKTGRLFELSLPYTRKYYGLV